eukprot:PhF_6_TR6845/c0_g1_i1/m.9856
MTCILTQTSIDDVLPGGLKRGALTELSSSHLHVLHSHVYDVINHCSQSGNHCLYIDTDDSFDPHRCCDRNVSVSKPKTCKDMDSLCAVIRDSESAFAGRRLDVVIIMSYNAMVELPPSQGYYHGGSLLQSLQKVAYTANVAVLIGTVLNPVYDVVNKSFHIDFELHGVKAFQYPQDRLWLDNDGKLHLVKSLRVDRIVNPPIIPTLYGCKHGSIPWR